MTTKRLVYEDILRLWSLQSICEVTKKTYVQGDRSSALTLIVGGNVIISSLWEVIRIVNLRMKECHCHTLEQYQ